MDGSGDVVNGHSLCDELVGFRIIQLDGSRVGQLREPRAIFFEVLQILGRRHGHRNHFPSLFRRADRKNLHARAGLFQHAHVLVNILGVGQHAGRTSYVAEHSFGSRHSVGRRKVIDEWRGEVWRRSVLLNFGSVRLVDGLFRIARRGGLSICGRGRGWSQNQEQRGKDTKRCVAHVSCIRHLDFSRTAITANADCSAACYSAVTKVKSTGEGTSTTCPVGVRPPVAESILKTTMLLENWFSASRYFPLGSIAKCRGSFPPVEACATKARVPFSGSIAKIAILSCPRLEAYRNLPLG